MDWLFPSTHYTTNILYLLNYNLFYLIMLIICLLWSSFKYSSNIYRCINSRSFNHPGRCINLEVAQTTEPSFIELRHRINDWPWWRSPVPVSCSTGTWINPIPITITYRNKIQAQKAQINSQCERLTIIIIMTIRRSFPTCQLLSNVKHIQVQFSTYS